MKPKVLRAIRWIMPSAGVIISTIVLCNSQLKLDEAKAKKDGAEKALAAAEQAREQALNMGNRSRFAAEAVTPNEEAKFLDGLKRHVNASGASIIKWTSKTDTYMPALENESKPGADPVLVGLTRVTSQLSLSGEYETLRAFLHAISKSHRLYTFQDIRWNRERGACLLSLSLSRYVAPPAEDSSALTVASARNGSIEVVK